MGRKILVSVDLSDHSKTVLEGAKKLAGEDDQIMILYVAPDPSRFAGFYVPHRSTEKMREELMEEAEERMKRFAKRYAREAVTHVRFGTTSEEIIRTAREEAAALIVIGSHQSQGWMDNLFSTRLTKKITRNAPCDVEVIPLPFDTEDEGSEPQEPPS